MAANLKIGIIADDGDAQKKFEGLSTSVDMTAKSVTQLANQFAKLNAAKVNILNTTKNTKELSDVTSAMTTTYKQLMNAIERQKISWGTTKDSVASLKKELAELEKVETLLISKGVGSSMSGELEDLTALTDKYAEYKKELQGVIKLKEEEEKLAAQKLTPSSILSGVQGTTGYKKNGLLGDNLSQMKQEYEAYSEALTKIINTLGAGSPEAERMASAMNELNKKIKDCSTQTTATTKRIGNLIKNFVSAQMIVWAIRKAFTSITTTLKEASEAASEAEETYNLFITTFENASITAEQTASRLSNALGIANSTAQETLGTFGDLAAGYGATDKEALEFAETATEVAMDIVSYKNISGDLSTTMQSLSSGLAGNVENFRKLGYVMTQAEVKAKLQQKGLDKLTGSALQYAQIQARLEILQEKSVKAQGDMIKTLDSTENVTRRLNESWLEWKENLGSTVNVVLTPMKRWLNEILTISNKVTSAMKEINGGEFTVKVEQVAEGEQLEKIVKNLFAKSNGSSSDFWRKVEEAVLGVSATDVSNVTGKEASDVALAVGTDIEKVIKIIDESSYFISEEEKKNARAIYQQEKADAEKRQKKEDAKNEALSAIQSAMSFIDNLNSINGVYGDDSSLSRRLENTQNGVTNNTSLEGDTQAVVNNLLANLSSASADSFVSALDIALGREDTESMLEAKLASVEEVYEALWNEFYSSGEELTEWQKGALEETLELAKSLNGQIEDLNKEVEEVKYSPSWSNGDYRTLSGISDSLSAYLSAFESMAGLTGASTYDISHKIEDYLSSISDALDGQLTEDEFNTFYKEAQSYFNTVTSTYSAGVNPASLSSDPYSYLTTLQKATGENTLLDALEAQLDAYTDYYEKAEAYFKVDGNLTAEEQTILGTLLGQISNIHDRIEEESKEPEEKAKESWEEAWDSMVENLQGIGEFFSSFTSEGFNFSGIINPLMDLVVQTEAFSEISSLLTDYILPVFNSFLEPLLPIIQTIGGLMQSMVQGLLIPLFPVVVEICALVTLIVGYVKAGFDLIVDTIQWVIGNAMKSILQALDAIIWGDQSGWYSGDTWVGKWANKDPWGDFLKAIDKTNEMVADIRACDFEIADNTSSDEMNLTVLNKLFESGVIDWDEMNALRASFLGQADPGKQTQLIAANAGDYASYLRSGSTTTISYGGITVEINSESGDPEKIADTVIRKMEEQLRNGRSGWSSATV